MSGVFLSRAGVVFSGGSGVDALWKACAEGSVSGARKVAAVSGKEFLAGIYDGDFPRDESARIDSRLARMEGAALAQIEKTIEAALSRYGASRVAVCVGSCDNGAELSLAAHEEFSRSSSFPAGYSLEAQGADYPATFISEKYGIEGPSAAFSAACSSSAQAIVKAAQMIRSGVVDAAVAGGVDAASDVALLGFDSLEALSGAIADPFSANRRGITLGEGAAFFALSRDPIDGDVKILGHGESADACHVTSPDPSGGGAARAMRAALESAGLSPGCIDYVNLHGTGTRLNDSMEAAAMREVFGEDCPVCGSTKPVTGHTLGAAGALECAICRETVERNKGRSGAAVVFPAHAWDGVFDDSIPRLNFASRGAPPEGARAKVCMTNSFAFGGANESIIIGE